MISATPFPIVRHYYFELPFVCAQITKYDFCNELQRNPVLAAALPPPYGDDALEEELGEHVLRDILRRRRTPQSNEHKKTHEEDIETRDDDNDRASIISWPEFAGVFLPLAQYKDTRGETNLEEKERGSSLWAKVEEEELQLLRVAFAAVVSGGCGDRLVSLAELRMASAGLDGEEPPEEPVRTALEVRNVSMRRVWDE